MTRAFRPMLRKEVAEFARTWRLAVLGGFVLFFALSSPLLAKLTPQILQLVGAGQAGVVIKIPTPTALDAYAQWLKNLSQIGAFVLLIVGSGSVAGEIASGTGILVLTKPVSRADFVAAKALVLLGYVIALVVAGTAIVQVETALVFGSAPPVALWVSTISWLAFAVALVGLSVLMSTLLPTLAAAGVSVLGFFALAAAVPLLRVPGWALVVAGVAFIVAAALAFARREL